LLAPRPVLLSVGVWGGCESPPLSFEYVFVYII
jgi:hypothetical protein